MVVYINTCIYDWNLSISFIRLKAAARDKSKSKCPHIVYTSTLNQDIMGLLAGLQDITDSYNRYCNSEENKYKNKKLCEELESDIQRIEKELEELMIKKKKEDKLKILNEKLEKLTLKVNTKYESLEEKVEELEEELGEAIDNYKEDHFK